MLRVLRSRLQELYARRSAVEAAIRELELSRPAVSSTGEAPPSKERLDLRAQAGIERIGYNERGLTV